jgi:cobalt-zinc-cadmium efflux system membrane fusion protein
MKINKITYKHGYPILAACFIILALACNQPVNTEPASPEPAEHTVALSPAQFKNANLVVGTLLQKEISALIRVKGKVDVPPQKLMSVSVPLGGYLKSSNLLPGMRVQKGEVIAVVEGEQYIQLQQDYLMAKEKLVWLEQEYTRQRELLATQSAPQKTFQMASADFSSQQVLVNALFQKLKLVGIQPENVTKDKISASISVRSGLSGYVAAVHVNAGKYLTPSDVLFEIISTDDIHLALKIFEKDIPMLQIGQSVMAYTNQQTEKKYPCRIILMGKEIAADRSIEIQCHFKQHNLSLLPGTFMNAEIEVKNKAATVLPDEALVRFDNRQFIFVQSDSLQFVMKEVQPGISENGYTQIINGVEMLKDKIVTRGSYTLLMMLKNKADE